MKYALYYTSNLAVVQWQDTDLYGYSEPSEGFGRIEIPANFPDFDIDNPVNGWWVVDGALTQTAPPAPLAQIAQMLQGAAFSRRANGVAAGVVLPDSTVFAPTDTDLTTRIHPVVVGHAVLGIAGIDLQLDGEWRYFLAAELQAAFTALMLRREAFYSAERAHMEAIAALLAANNRIGLETYDVTTGWPA